MSDSPKAIINDMAPLYMMCMAVGAPALGCMTPYNGFIQGIGNSKMSLIFSILDGFVARITLSYLIGIVAGLGLKGFFLGYFLAPYFTTIPAMIYYYSGIWKKKKITCLSFSQSIKQRRLHH